MSPELPAHNIQPADSIPYESWFTYPVRVHPHHTDYAGIVWHGTYLAWLEEARVEGLRSLGIHFEDLVSMGCDIPVVELSIRYQRSLTLGKQAVVQSRILPHEKVRIVWEQIVQSPDASLTYITAQVVNVPLDREKGTILRKLPPELKYALSRVSGPSGMGER
ncbi:MAG: thioesterase family protein [Leptolyngbyaceae bacterium]|nr:thioesterase family protein [Leptolyngbyaceae bacterium]